MTSKTVVALFVMTSLATLVENSQAVCTNNPPPKQAVGAFGTSVSYTEAVAEHQAHALVDRKLTRNAIYACQNTYPRGLVTDVATGARTIHNAGSHFDSIRGVWKVADVGHVVIDYCTVCR